MQKHVLILREQMWTSLASTWQYTYKLKLPVPFVPGMIQLKFTSQIASINYTKIYIYI